MSKLVWDKVGERFYETGVEKGVLYNYDAVGGYNKGVAWNGLSSVSETPSGAEATKIYADNINYLNMYSVEELGGTIEAYQSPKEFDVCDGTAEVAPGMYIGQQSRKMFGLCYRTNIGNDTDGNDHAYKLHLIYGAMASPSERQYQTINDSPEANTLSWEFTTTPVSVEGFKPTSLVTIKSNEVDADNLAALEEILYGTDNVDPRLPLPDEVASILKNGAAVSTTSISG